MIAVLSGNANFKNREGFLSFVNQITRTLYFSLNLYRDFTLSFKNFSSQFRCLMKVGGIKKAYWPVEFRNDKNVEY